MMEFGKFWHTYSRRYNECVSFYNFAAAGSTYKKCYNGNKSEKHQFLKKRPKLKTISYHTIFIRCPEQVTTFIHDYTPQSINKSMS
jgi:hypothetical protein